MRIEGRKPTIEESIMLGPEAFNPESLPEDPSALDVAAAGFRQQNPVSSWYESLYFQSEEEDLQGYNPMEGLNSKYLPWMDEFEDVRSPDQRLMKEAEIDSKIRDIQTVSDAGFEGIAWSLAAGVIDPMNLPLLFVPLVGTGAGATRIALATAAVGAVEAGASEALLHSTQPTRTWQESLGAMGATAVLGGLLGGISGASYKHTAKIYQRAEKDIVDIVERGGIVDLEEAAGASRVAASAEDEASKLLGPGINPIIRMLKQPSAEGRKFANDFYRHDFELGKNSKQIDYIQPDGTVRRVQEHVENKIPVDAQNEWMHKKYTAIYLRTAQKEYTEMLGSKGFARARIKARLGRDQKFSEFMEDVGKAMRLDDESVSPYVARTAAKIRKEVISPITKGFQELGELPENLKVKYARSYFTRVYDVRHIEKNLPEWHDMLFDHYMTRGKFEGEGDAKKLVPMTEREAEIIAREVTDHVLGTPMGRLPDSVIPKSGRLQERVLDIPDEVLERHRFLISNADDVMQAFLRTTVPHLNLMRRFGDIELKGVVSAVRKDYDDLIRAAGDDAKKTARLRKQRTWTERDIKMSRDVMLGRNLPSAGERGRMTNLGMTLRGMTFMAMLGKVLLASFPDAANPMIKRGARAWAKALPRALLYHGKATKLARHELEMSGVVAETMLSSRIYALADVMDFGTRMHKWTQGFARHSGINHWTQFWKMYSSFVTQNRFIDDAIGYAKLKPKHKTALAKAGINEDMAKRIAAQAQERGEKLMGSWHANTRQWKDRDAAELFDQILSKDVDSTVVTPGLGDKPLFMSKEWGKTLMQFKTFFLSAHNQIFIPGAQNLARGDMAVLQGMTMGLALGMIVEWSRMHASGRADVFEEYSMLDWVRAGLDRSGMLPLPMELINISDRFTQGRVANAWGMQTGSRYSLRNELGTLLGPVASYGQDTYSLLSNLITEGGITARDIHGIRRLLPYQNMFYLHRLLNQMEENVIEATGAERRSYRGRKPVYIR